MRPTFRVPLIVLLFFCAIQLLALYIWLPRRMVQRDIGAGHLESDGYLQVGKENQTLALSPGGLLSQFDLLAQEGRERGLSDKVMMGLLLQALGDEAGNLTRSGIQQKKVLKQRLRTHHKTSDLLELLGKLDNDTREIEGTREKILPNVTSPTEKKFIRSDGYLHLETYPWDKIIDPVNPHDFRLVINQANLCRTNESIEDDVFLLVLMISKPSDATQRQMQRDTCLSVREVSGRTIRHVFLLGDSGKASVTEALHEEAAVHGDIIMENFMESYRNLTLKTLMGLKWASVYCPQAKYVIKTDDDVFLSLTNTMGLLEKSPRKRFMTGFVYRGTKPIRDKRFKWYIAEESYPRNIYPPYCCGIGYILSNDIVPWVFARSLTIPYIFLEDVFVGLCIEKISVVPTTNPGFFAQRSDYDYCKFKKANVVHLKKIHDIDKYWVQQQTKPANVTC